MVGLELARAEGELQRIEGKLAASFNEIIDSNRRPVRGLPASVVGGSMADAVAVWRGAFLARGSLTEPGRSMALEVTCPGSEAALALVGAALGVLAGLWVTSRLGAMPPWTFTAGTATLALLAASIAAVLPALYAATRDPVRVLRTP